MEPINLNGDATTLTIDTTIAKRDVLLNKLEEECSKLLEKYKHLVEDNPTLNYPNVMTSNIDNFFDEKCAICVMHLIF